MAGAVRRARRAYRIELRFEPQGAGTELVMTFRGERLSAVAKGHPHESGLAATAAEQHDAERILIRAGSIRSTHLFAGSGDHALERSHPLPVPGPELRTPRARSITK